MRGLLWTFAEVLAATGGEPEGEGAPDMGSVSIDSRTVESGALFVAIRGDNQDGHRYVAKAFGGGAAAALVATDAEVGAEGPLVRVPETLEALNRLGAAARARTEAKVIAVTGSVGKTGTKEALRLALAPGGSVHASIKSYNNHWGVPLTLANMPRETRFGVVEIGMNHAGEITPLTRLARPHVAIVTTVEPVHLEFFASVEEIADAKAEIFLGLEPGGAAVLNIDNPHFARLKQKAEATAARVVSFGSSDGADARLLSLTALAEGSDIEADILGRRLRYRLGASGRHLAMNSLAVLAAVSLAGADTDAAAKALADCHAPQGRGARSQFDVNGGRVVVIDESYNANPASMRAALASLGAIAMRPGMRRIAVLGDMLELGHSSEELHRGLADAVDASGADVVFACGPRMHALFEAIPAGRRGGWEQTAELLQPRVLAEVRPGDVVMIKGSLGSRMGPIVEALRDRLSGAG
ncbi:MAG: UDP-N-acetylmuramoylalanyl-D-glutamyl-2,6-diaminopimelate--D-alanyl-D-alanine ligase [Hyphomicrobiales bacterium]